MIRQTLLVLLACAAFGQAPNLPFTITTTFLPVAQVNQPFSTQLTSVGARGAVNWSTDPNAFPAGLRLSPDGTISGTPQTVETLALRVTASDSSGGTLSTNVTYASARGNLSITNENLSPMTVGQPYTAQLQSSGGAPPYRYTLAGPGFFDDYFTLSPSGLISGTGTNGLFTLRVIVEDSAGQSATKALILGANSPGVRFGSTSPPLARLGQPYQHPLAVQGGQSPWRISSSAYSRLPPGLSVTDGVLTGIPARAGVFQFTLTGSDSTFRNSVAGNFVLSVDGGEINFVTSSLPPARLNQPYSQRIETSGGQDPIRFDLAPGSAVLPNGLVLSAAGLLSGTPVQSGSFPFTVRASDAQARNRSLALVLTITGGGLSLLSPALPEARVGSPYSQAVTATGGVSPYSYSLASGSLPPGLALASTGILSGTPLQSGAYSFGLRIRDAAGDATDAMVSLTVAAASTPLSLSTTPASANSLLLPLFLSATALGGTPPYTWDLQRGSLPSGLFFLISGPTLSVTGVPLAPGDYEPVFRVRDARGVSAEFPLSLNIPAPFTLPVLTQGQEGSLILPAPASGLAPFTYPTSNRLPRGLSLLPNGTLSGTPQESGYFFFSLALRDSRGATVPAAYRFLVRPTAALAIEIPALPGATAGVPYRLLPSLSGAPSARWSLRDGSLPAGLDLNPGTGEISGTPVASGLFYFSLRAVDSSAAEANFSAYLAIAPAASPSLDAVTSAASYVSGGLAPGEILTLFGRRLGPASLESNAPQQGKFPSSLAGVRVLFDGIPAPILYVQASQLSVVAPFRLEGQSLVSLLVEVEGRPAAPSTLEVLAAKPALFTANGSGRGPGALLNQDGSVNTAQNPAGPGSVVVLYLTGAGSMNPPGQDGHIATALSGLSQVPTAQIADLPATVLYAGNAPGIVEGAIQMNVQVPSAAPSGAVPVAVRIGEAPSSPGVTLWIR